MAEKRFIKGLFKDTAHIDQPAGSWRYAKNAIINDKKGSVSNEGGTDYNVSLQTTSGNPLLNHKVIGAIEAEGDRVVLFLKSTTLPVAAEADPVTSSSSSNAVLFQD